MILFFIFLQYKIDCKEFGKENLAVSLKERLTTYLLFVFLPGVLCLLMRN